MNQQLTKQFDNILQNTQVKIPDQVKAMLEDGIDKARAGLETVSESLKETAKQHADAVVAQQAVAKDLGERLVQNAMSNVDATLDVAQALMKARTISEIANIQTKFAQNQMNSFWQQSREFFELSNKLSSDFADRYTAMTNAVMQKAVRF